MEPGRIELPTSSWCWTPSGGASGARVGATQMPSCRRRHPPKDTEMAKGLDKKKEQKKKPAKTLKEKRADKQEKKGAR